MPNMVAEPRILGADTVEVDLDKLKSYKCREGAVTIRVQGNQRPFEMTLMQQTVMNPEPAAHHDGPHLPKMYLLNTQLFT
jgi:hypothetical protein